MSAYPGIRPRRDPLCSDCGATLTREAFYRADATTCRRCENARLAGEDGLRIYNRVGDYIVLTEQDSDGYQTRILVVNGEDSDGAGQPLLDVDEAWEIRTKSEESAILAHGSAIIRAQDERWDDTATCAACGRVIDPLDEDDARGRCGSCASENDALDRAAS